MSTLQPLPVGSLTIEAGFWAEFQELNRSAIIPHSLAWVHRMGWVGNFEAAAAGQPFQHVGVRVGQAPGPWHYVSTSIPGASPEPSEDLVAVFRPYYQWGNRAKNVPFRGHTSRAADGTQSGAVPACHRW